MNQSSNNLSFYTKDLYSLYIHWPFCSSKCFYCDFVAMEQHQDYQELYHQALLKEISLFAKTMPRENRLISTIFIGGGTPSLYPINLLNELFETLHTHFDITDAKEISLEANPADITEEKLDAWYSMGINRLSVGAQVLDDQALLHLNRRQRIRDVAKAAQQIPKYFDNYSFDLILGLPKVTQQTWDSTVLQVTNWQPQHISIYFLTVHEKTPLYFAVKNKKMSLPEENEIINLYEKTQLLLNNKGYQSYEISNYARAGFQSLHNKGYWDQKNYKGFGLGACSFDGRTRLTNHKNLTRYISLMNDNQAPTQQQETLTTQQKKIEAIMLSLRQSKGMDLQHMIYLLKENEKEPFFNNINHLKSQSLIKEKNGRITLTLKGILVENEIILKLI